MHGLAQGVRLDCASRKPARVAEANKPLPALRIRSGYIPKYLLIQLFRNPSKVSYEAFWRTTTCGLTYSGRRPSMRHRSSYNSLLHLLDMCWYMDDALLSDYWPQPGYPHRYMQLAIERWAVGRRFCTTEDCRYGCLPRAAGPGDVICLIYGGRYP